MSDMEYNECATCGAGGGRCGLTIDGGHGFECENCRKTRETGTVSLCANLERTEEEGAKTMAILEKPASPGRLDEVILKIAQETLGLSTFEEKWAIKEALEKAYLAGRESILDRLIEHIRANAGDLIGGDPEHLVRAMKDVAE